MIAPGDIVNIAVGRGWRKAKVIKKLEGENILVKLRNGETRQVTADNVMTDEETKGFTKAGGHTKIVRNEDSALDTNGGEDEEGSDNSESRMGKFFGGKL